MCPANLACRADSRIPASDPALRIPACELPSRTAPASPRERTRLAIPPCEPRRAVPPCELPRRTPTSDPAIRAISVWACSRRPSPYTGRRASPLRSVRQNAREVRSQRLAVARYRSDAFPKGPLTGKMPVRGKILPPCIQNELVLARFARYASENRRKAPFGNAPREDLAAKAPFSLRAPLESRMARKSCHPLMILAFRWQDAFPEGWDALFLLLRWCEFGRSCLAGKPPVPSLSSGRSPSTAFPGGWRAFTFPLRRIEAEHKKGDPRGSPFCWLDASRLALAVQAGWFWRCELALTALVPRLLAQVAGRLALAVRPTC